jgi:hypothetical protein
MRINQSISEEAEKNVRASLKVQLKTQKDYTENVLTLLKDENKERLKEYAGYYAVQDRISKSKTDYGVGVSMGSTTYKSSNKEAEEWLNSDAAIPYKIAYELSTKTKEQQEEIKNNVLKWTGAELKIAQEQGKKYDDEKKILGMKKANSGGSSTSAKETKQVETMSEKYNNLVVKIQEVSEALREAKRNGDIFGQIENTELLNKLNKERDGILENIRLYEKFKNTISKPLPPSFSFSTNEEGKKASKGKPYPVVSQSKMTDYSFELSAIAKKNIVNAREEFERMKEENELLENSFANLGNELLNFGNAIGGISDNPGLRALAASLMILSGVEKLAKSVTVWDFIAGAIGLASSIVAFGSQVSSAKFAGGGIVGDQNIVRMNEGELILNKAQQTRLFNQINSGEIGTHSSNQYEFVIRGENLVGVQKNYNSKFNK